MKTKNIVGVGLLLVGGFLLYNYMKNKPKVVEQPTDGTGTGDTGGTGGGTGTGDTGIGGTSPDDKGNCPEGTEKLVINCIAAPCPPATCVPIGKKDVLDRPADFGDRWTGTRDPFVIPDLANPFVNPSDINTPQVDDFNRDVRYTDENLDFNTDGYISRDNITRDYQRNIPLTDLLTGFDRIQMM